MQVAAMTTPPQQPVDRPSALDARTIREHPEPYTPDLSDDPVNPDSGRRRLVGEGK